MAARRLTGCVGAASVYLQTPTEARMPEAASGSLPEGARWLPEGLSPAPLAGRAGEPTVVDMTAMTSVPTDHLRVRPGGEASAEITIHNTGRVVDSFQVEPLGALAPWTRVEPETLALMPGTQGTVLVSFHPPRTPQLAAGEVPWAVRVVPSEDPDGTTVEEGVLDVEPFTEVTAEMRPRTSHARGRRAGKHELALDNLGNTSVDVYLTGGDADQKLDVTVEPERLTVVPGGAAVVPVRAQARKRFWRGQAVTHPFQVVVEPAGQPPVVVDGSLLQEAVVPAWVVKALLALMLLAALAALLWFAVLKPTIKDTAQAIASEEAQQATAEEAAAREAADDSAADAASADREKAQSQIDQLNKALGKPIKEPATTVDPLGTPVTTRLAATAGTQDPSAVLDPRRVVSVTDLLLQNANGDSGLVSILRDDQTVYEARLENFRDLDLHLVAPILVGKGDRVGLTVSCSNPNPPGPAQAAPCTTALTIQGFARATP